MITRICADCGTTSRTVPLTLTGDRWVCPDCALPATAPSLMPWDRPVSGEGE